MGYAPKQRPVIRVKFKTNPDYWAEIYASLRFKEQKALGMVEGDGERYITLTADVLITHLLCNWNLDDADGNPLPISPEHIDELEKPDADALLTAIGKVIRIEWDRLEKAQTRKKKIAPEIITALTQGSSLARRPYELMEYELCRHFGWTPEEARNLDSEDFDLYYWLMVQELQAQRINNESGFSS